MLNVKMVVCKVLRCPFERGSRAGGLRQQARKVSGASPIASEAPWLLPSKCRLSFWGKEERLLKPGEIIALFFLTALDPDIPRDNFMPPLEPV